MNTTSTRTVAKVKIISLSRKKEIDTMRGPATRQFGVVIHENRYVKVDISNVTKQLDIAKIYLISNYNSDTQNMRLHSKTVISRSYPDQSTVPPTGEEVPDTSNGLFELITSSAYETKDQDRKYSAIGKILTVSNLEKLQSIDLLYFYHIL
jgi:hypothetical protein